MNNKIAVYFSIFLICVFLLLVLYIFKFRKVSEITTNSVTEEDIIDKTINFIFKPGVVKQKPSLEKKYPGNYHAKWNDTIFELDLYVIYNIEKEKETPDVNASGIKKVYFYFWPHDKPYIDEKKFEATFISWSDKFLSDFIKKNMNCKHDDVYNFYYCISYNKDEDKIVIFEGFFNITRGLVMRACLIPKQSHIYSKNPQSCLV